MRGKNVQKHKTPKIQFGKTKMAVIPFLWLCY
jgi:hypothetical protein